MNVSMIRGLAEQHKALKAFHAQCNRSGASLTVTVTERGYPEGEATLESGIAALIISDVRVALLKRISESETAILEAANGKK